MPITMDIQHASEEFEAFLADAHDRSGLATRNQTYTMTQGVLQAFRRRLSLADAIRFAFGDFEAAQRMRRRRRDLCPICRPIEI